MEILLVANKLKKKIEEKVTEEKNKGKSMLKELKNKLKSSQKELQQQVDELTAQVKALSKDSAKPAQKLFNKLEKNYHQKMSELQVEFDDRLESLSKMQDKVVAQLPKELAEKLNLKEKSPEKPEKDAPKKAKAAAPKKARAPKAPSIASITGIGPVIQKKLAEAGFNTLEDLVNTSESKVEALKQFAKAKGFDTWKQQAEELLGKK